MTPCVFLLSLTTKFLFMSSITNVPFLSVSTYQSLLDGVERLRAKSSLDGQSKDGTCVVLYDAENNVVIIGDSAMKNIIVLEAKPRKAVAHG